MSIIREALCYLVDLGQAAGKAPEISELEGRQRYFWHGEMKTIPKPRTTKLGVKTLNGLAQAVKGPDKIVMDQWMARVTSPTEVLVESVLGHVVPGEREVFAIAQPHLPTFTFNHYLDQEKFIIGVMACFDDADDRAEIIKVAGSLRGESTVVSDDDGITQQASLRQGARMEYATIKNPVTLRPFRTFPELVQPAGKYIFRVQREEDGPPTVGLFEVYDGQWQLEAMSSIEDWLNGRLEDLTVIR